MHCCWEDAALIRGWCLLIFSLLNAAFIRSWHSFEGGALSSKYAYAYVISGNQAEVLFKTWHHCYINSSYWPPHILLSTNWENLFKH